VPAPKFDRSMVKLIAEEAGVPEVAVWVDVPHEASDDEKVKVCFWTAKMSGRQFERLASINAANFRGSKGGGLSRRLKVAFFLEALNAEGWLTKVNPREAKPHELFPLKGPKTWCACGDKLVTAKEQFIGKCEGCCPN